MLIQSNRRIVSIKSSFFVRIYRAFGTSLLWRPSDPREAAHPALAYESEQIERGSWGRIRRRSRDVVKEMLRCRPS
jgi:hypothetical protein